ncbi:hypothetical protein [Magnetococcus marinus]|nr:hypothetical protein [Magnetococcus marinus]
MIDLTIREITGRLLVLLALMPVSVALFMLGAWLRERASRRAMPLTQ